MIGHGTFIYNPDAALDRFGDAPGVVKAIMEAKMSYAWLRVHNKNGLWKTSANKKIAQALRDSGLGLGVWGWCDGNNVDKDIGNAREAIRNFNPDYYIADIEDGVSGASWNASRAKKLAEAVKAELGTRPLIVSSFGYIDWHKPEIMTAMNGSADYFAPQVYWFRYPNPRMMGEAPSELADLPTDNAASYSKLCLHQWSQAVTKPLILTGQAYWGEGGSGWTRELAEEKLAEFASDFDAFNKLAGLNWWHFAGIDAMSKTMLRKIADADFPLKLPSGAIRSSTSSRSHPLGGRAHPPTSGTFKYVAAEDVYFRSSPVGGGASNLIAKLDHGHSVQVSGPVTASGYVNVTTKIGDQDIVGYIASTYLRDPEVEKVERLVAEAISEWKRFEKGSGFEDVEPYSGYIAEMWRARGYNNISGKDTDWYWSAAFISFVLENAGYTRIKLDIRHSTYIHEAIQNRVLTVDGDFWGYKLIEEKPEVGDILCQWRGAEMTYEKAEFVDRFDSHTDLVIAVRPDSVITLGGNVSNGLSGTSGVSVDTKVFRLGADGHLVTERRLFAIMKNRARLRAHNQDITIAAM